MALTAQQEQFIQTMTPYAQWASAATGWTPQLILAQWGNETGWGTSHAFLTNHNLGGIGVTTTHATGQVNTSLQGGVQAYINFINSNPRYASVKAAGPTTAKQAYALAVSGWASGEYGAYNTVNGQLVPTGQPPGSSLPIHTITPSIAPISGPAGGVATTGPSGVPGGGTGAVAVASTGTALATVDHVLKKAGLTGLIGWANTEVTNLASQGFSGQALTTALSTALYTQPTFKARFPGMTERKANGFNAITVTQYLAYETNAKSLARTAGLPTGFMGKTEIANLIGNNVSATELTHRVTKAYEVAMNSPPETRTLLTQYFGIKTGTLAAYFLTPKKGTAVLTNAVTQSQIAGEGQGHLTTAIVQQQVTAAQIGTAAKTAGYPTLPAPQLTATVGKAKPTGRVEATALYLAKQGVTQGTAQSTFQALSKLAPLTEALPGTGAGKTSLSVTDLTNFGFFGTRPQEIQNVEQTRTAPFHGGGGPVESSRGVLGAGYASGQGQSGT